MSLIEQLQRGVDTNQPPDKTDRIMTEAAAEIARLRSDLAVEKINNKRLQSERNNAEAEIHRLRAALGGNSTERRSGDKAALMVAGRDGG